MSDFLVKQLPYDHRQITCDTAPGALGAVRQQCHEIGYGVGDNMDALVAAHGGNA